MKRQSILEFNKLSNEIIMAAQRITTVDPKFLYALRKNKDKIQPIVIDFQKKVFERKSHEKSDEFQAKRVALCELYAEKDADGKAVVADNQFQFVEGTYEEFQGKYKELEEEYKEVVEDQKTFEEEMNKILAEDVEMDIYKIKVDWLPSGVITGGQLNFLYDNGFITD